MSITVKKPVYVKDDFRIITIHSQLDRCQVILSQINDLIPLFNKCELMTSFDEWHNEPNKQHDLSQQQVG